MSQRFPRRLDQPEASPPVSVRDAAPDHLRKYVKYLMEHFNVTYTTKKWLMSEAFELAESDFIDRRKGREEAISDALAQCKWEHIYALIEVLHDHIFGLHLLVRREDMAQQYTTTVNGYFHQNGIGFQLVDGKIEYRGDDDFEVTLDTAQGALEQAGWSRARTEFFEARRDLSRRPDPDLSGAIDHSTNALESVARSITGELEENWGNILRKRPDLLPETIIEAIRNIRKFAQENARHVREDKVPTFDESELVVHVSAAAATYLVRKSGLIDGNQTS